MSQPGFEHYEGPKSPEEVSEYLVERTQRENPLSEKSKKEKLKPEEARKKTEELVGLIEEKEDELRNKAADERIVAGDEAAKNGLKPIKIGRGVYFNPRQLHESMVEIEDENLKKIKREIGVLANNEQIARAYQEMLKTKIEAIRLAREVERKDDEVMMLQLENATLLAHRNSEDLKLSRSDKQKLEINKTSLEERVKEKDALMKVPAVYREFNRRQLLEYRRQLASGGFVETPSVKEKIAQILGHLQLGIPVFLRGHLGAGKTEMLLHISRKYYGVEPEFISGSEESSKYDMFTKTQIGLKPKEDRIKDYEERIAELQRFNLTPEELEETKKEYYKEIVVEGKITSFSQSGPLIRAMKEGKPIVIDEIDGIPHSILMRLNHVLTRRVGDKFKIQENGGEEVEVKEGFCVMATGNIKSVRYKREELDAAFLSRWWSSEIGYVPEDETLKLIISALIDKRGNLELNTADDFTAIKNLVPAAAEIQKIFKGEKLDYLGEGGDAGRGISASLEKSVLSMRDIWNIVKPWKAHNFDKPLDNYILEEFVKTATVPKDSIYLTQLFCRYGFFKKEDWPAEKMGISGLTDKKLEAFRATTASAGAAA